MPGPTGKAGSATKSGRPARHPSFHALPAWRGMTTWYYTVPSRVDGSCLPKGQERQRPVSRATPRRGRVPARTVPGRAGTTAAQSPPIRQAQPSSRQHTLPSRNTNSKPSGPEPLRESNTRLSALARSGQGFYAVTRPNASAAKHRGVQTRSLRSIQGCASGKATCRSSTKTSTCPFDTVHLSPSVGSRVPVNTS